MIVIIILNNIEDLEFIKPYILDYYETPLGYVHNNNDLCITVYGKTLEELKKRFNNTFITLWCLLVLCNKTELKDKDNIELRNNLKKLIKNPPSSKVGT